MSAPLPSLAFLPNPVLDLDSHRTQRTKALYTVATGGAVSLVALWYVAGQGPVVAGVLLLLSWIVLRSVWGQRWWLVQVWAERHLPKAAMEQRIYVLLDQHRDAWMSTSVVNGSAPCVVQWRWKQEGLWLEQCSVFPPGSGLQNERRRLPVCKGQALVPHKVGLFAWANRLFAAGQATHRGMLVLEWTTAHGRLAVVHAVAHRANGTVGGAGTQGQPSHLRGRRGP